MATEDVIELGSSDDDAEPAPKKTKTIPNAMVHIPTKLPGGLTIKPTKSKQASVKPPVIGNRVTVTKVNSPSARQNIGKVNGKQTPRLTVPTIASPSIGKVVQNPLRPPFPSKNVPVTKKIVNNVNPYSLINKLGNTQLKINKVPVKAISQKSKVNPVRPLKNPIKIHSPHTINNLPASVTVVRTVPLNQLASTTKSTTFLNNPTPTNKRKRNIKSATVTTVNLDDEDMPQASTSSPQWYLRPEEQIEPKESQDTTLNEKGGSAVPQEKVNNAAPEKARMIEITIEDSPIKSIYNKNTFGVGAELAITIDDSPIKPVADKDPLALQEEVSSKVRTPHSKKKLIYPSNTDITTENTTIEIEIEPMEVIETHIKEPEKSNDGAVKAVEAEKRNDDEADKGNDDIIVEVFESPAKPLEVQSAVTPKKKDTRRPEITPKLAKPVALSSGNGEFHPVYQQFIDLCFKLENSEDMKKIVEKKIKGYYRQVPKEYTESEEFIDMVSSKIVAMQAGPDKMYLYIKDIVDELNMQRKMAKAQPTKKDSNKITESEKFQFPEDSEFDEKRQRQIRKLEKTIKKLHRAIQKLEEQEVDFDDEEDSVYLLTESDEDGPSHKDDTRLMTDRNVLLKRYKERMIRVHAKFCQLTNTKLPSEPRVVIEARPGQPTGPAKRLEKWVNRKVPIGTPLPFPDFHDVLRCVREANEEDKLGWNEADIMEEARDLFTRCGKKLQRRRQENEWRLAASRISADIDPAEQSVDLQKKLEENRQVGTKKETEVFNKFADRQSQLKLEPEEIGDKEAEESPVDEDEEEEANEECSNLENKEKRKERIKKLLKSKAKKTASDNQEEIKQNEDVTKTKKQSEVADNKDNETLEINRTNEEVKGTEQSVNNETGEHSQTKEKERVHSISDDSNKVESEVDELHLLQKLHSGDEANTSTVDSTDTDTPIDISDSIQSSSDGKTKKASDVISIENSSYSESENKEVPDCDAEQMLPIITESHTEVDESEMDTESCVQLRLSQTNDEENNTIGNILLASSEDDDQNSNSETEETHMNIIEDALSIGDTIVQGESNDKDNTPSTNVNQENEQDDFNSDKNQSSIGDAENKALNEVTEIASDSNILKEKGVELPKCEEQYNEDSDKLNSTEKYNRNECSESVQNDIEMSDESEVKISNIRSVQENLDTVTDHSNIDNSGEKARLLMEDKQCGDKLNTPENGNKKKCNESIHSIQNDIKMAEVGKITIRNVQSVIDSSETSTDNLKLDDVENVERMDISDNSAVQSQKVKQMDSNLAIDPQTIQNNESAKDHSDVIEEPKAGDKMNTTKGYIEEVGAEDSLDQLLEELSDLNGSSSTAPEKVV